MSTETGEAAFASRVRRRAHCPRQASSSAICRSLDIVGIYPELCRGPRAWKAAAQRTVDNAHDALLHRPYASPAGTGRTTRRPTSRTVTPSRTQRRNPRRAAGARRAAARAAQALLRDWVCPRWRELLVALVLTALLAAATGAYPMIIKAVVRHADEGPEPAASLRARRPSSAPRCCAAFSSTCRRSRPTASSCA